jgi:hypothetical protein
MLRFALMKILYNIFTEIQFKNCQNMIFIELKYTQKCMGVINADVRVGIIDLLESLKIVFSPHNK